MTWVKLDDRFPDHPKVGELSDGAFRAFVNSLCYSAEHLTDGSLPAAFIARSKQKVTSELLDAGLWEQRNGHGGIRVHNYLEYQPSSEQIRAKRRTDSERKTERKTTGRS